MTNTSSETPKSAVVGNFTDSSQSHTMKNEVKSVSPLTSINENGSSDSAGGGESHKSKKKRRSSFKKKGVMTKKLLIKFLDSAGFQAYMFVCLVLALFAVDVIAMHSYGEAETEAMNVILMLVFASFLVEMLLNMTIREDYSKLETMMNFIATFSILLDITWITELWESGEGGGGSYERASRAARVGARAGRIGRIVRVVRLVRVIKMFTLFFRCFRKDEEEDSMAPTNLGQKLSESISRLVALLIMITIWVAPMLTFEEFDESLSAWITVFDSQVEINATRTDLEPFVEDYYKFIMDGGLLRPKELHVYDEYWDWRGVNGGYTPRKKDKITLKSSDKGIVLRLDASQKNQEDALLNILLVVVVVAELIIFIALLNRTTSQLVVRPLERIFTIIRINASQIVGALEIDDSEDESDEEKEKDEINTIEAAVQKMTRIVKHVSGGGTQGSQLVQNYIDDANIDDKTKAWLMNQYDGTQETEATEGPKAKKKKERKFKRSIIAYDNVDLDFLNSWDFDVFLLKDDEMYAYVRAMFMELGLYEAEMVNDELLSLFLKEVRKMYHDNPYHNFHHCMDVTHGVYRMLRLTEDRLDLTQYERMSLIVAAICHDMDHPGVNNAYLTHTLDPLAIKYNDSSVLENTHVACLYNMVTSKPQSNIFKNIKDDKIWRDMRKNIIGCILHTDMAHHFKMVSQMDVFYELHAAQIEKKAPNVFETPEDRQFLMNCILHSADISNAVKPFGVYTKWANCVLEEFFSQGDKEAAKGLPKSPMMDRETTSRAMSQVNFIEFIVGPLYLNLVKILPELAELAINLLHNRKTWGELYLEELDGKQMDANFDFSKREEEKAKSANRFLKFKDKFEPVLSQLYDQGFATMAQMQVAGLVEKTKPKISARQSVMANIARRASISMNK